MYTEIPLWLSLGFICGGLFLLYFSAEKFIEGAAAAAYYLGISPFIVGMFIVGFGTSAPELCVSVMSGIAGHSGLSLGNAYGSDIFNILAILGVTALFYPVFVQRGVLVFNMPLLLAACIGGFILFYAGNGFSRIDGLICVGAFAVLMPIFCKYDSSAKKDAGAVEAGEKPSIGRVRAAVQVVAGLLLLILSSHILVWGSVDLARAFGVSDLMIGLTVVGIGTSMPELAAAIASAKRGQSEMIIGNIVGSNFFNTLAVVGIAGSITPFVGAGEWVFKRDLPFVILSTLMLICFSVNFKKRSEGGCINRFEAALMLLVYAVYFAIVIWQETNAAAVAAN